MPLILATTSSVTTQDAGRIDPFRTLESYQAVAPRTEIYAEQEAAMNDPTQAMQAAFAPPPSDLEKQIEVADSNISIQLAKQLSALSPSSESASLSPSSESASLSPSSESASPESRAAQAAKNLMPLSLFSEAAAAENLLRQPLASPSLKAAENQIVEELSQGESRVKTLVWIGTLLMLYFLYRKMKK